MTKETEQKFQEIYFPTGCDLLDLVVGGGMGCGFPSGKVVNLVGDKSSGKTFLACELIAAAFQKYGDELKWNYDDAESGFTFDTKRMYGIEIMPQDPEKRVKSRTVEEMFCNYRLFLQSLGEDEVGIYVVDSLDGLTSEENEKRGEARLKAFQEGKEFKQGSYQMGAAKFLSQEFFKGITEETEKKKCLLVIISQVRENIEPFGFEKYVRSGGKALDFYAHTVLWLAYMKKITRKDRTVGVVVKAKTTKSKTPRPFRECIFTLLFDYGLDNIGTSIDFLFDFRTETGMVKSNASAVWQGVDETLANLTEFIEQQNKMDEYKAEQGTVSKKRILAYLDEHDGELGEARRKFFGMPMKRDELIAFVEKEKLQNVLRERVLLKWEEIECSILTNRQPKYSQGKNLE